MIATEFSSCRINATLKFQSMDLFNIYRASIFLALSTSLGVMEKKSGVVPALHNSQFLGNKPSTHLTGSEPHHQ